MLICLLVTLLSWQHPQDPAMHRGDAVMGFDQAKTAHHFYLYPDGGAIDVRVKEATDAKDLEAIRSHLPHIAMMFGQGDFDAPMLVHDTKDVPGIGVLAARRAQITYRYTETPAGGRVDITTTDRDALAALHEFLRYQIREHKTGDPATVTRAR
jgi:hypothetical protein